MAVQNQWKLVAALFCIIVLLLLWRREHQTLHLVLTDTTLDTQEGTVKGEYLLLTHAGFVKNWRADGQDEVMSGHSGQLNTSRDASCDESVCHFGPIVLSASEHAVAFKLESKDGQRSLKAELGLDFNNSSSFQVQYNEEQGEVMLRLADVADAKLRSYKYKGTDCVDMTWKAKKCVTEVLTDCIDLGTGHWYGGSELGKQLWPLEKVQLPLAPYVAQTYHYGPVQERWFFNSNGGGIYIEENIPLFVSINMSNDRRICLQAKYDMYNYFNENETLPELNYTMCLASNVRTIHQLMSDRYIKKPSATPSHDVFRYPIWSTWAQYKTSINQTLVQEFVKDVKKHNFSISQVEIDDIWTTTYGDMEFDPKTFPDPKCLVDSMHSQNISVTLWVHPFVNMDAKSFSFLAKTGLMMTDVTGKSPALASWWHGNTAGHLDFSNPDTVKWFLFELQTLRTTYGIDSFKFDAGDVNFLPPVFKAHKQYMNKNNYARLYATVADEADPDQRRHEVRVGARTQNLPTFVRILDRDSTWTLGGGLKSVITTGLCFGILGYPFLLPDYVAGNSYGAKPDPELFIRWVQANALMPTMQFSLLPWASNNSTVLEVSQDMVKLHEKYSDLIIQLAEQSVTTGYPIMRPLWWIAPTDESALTVDDQFLLGDDVLVAPVVEQGQTTRRLYLPVGRWHDASKGQVYDGGKWIDYPVTLRDLPYFTRVK